MTLDITPLLVWLIAVVLVLVATYLGTKIQYALGATKGEARYVLDALITSAVMAAEQRFRENGEGRRKLEYALAFLRAACSRYGLKFDEAVIAPMVEARVYEMFAAAKAIAANKPVVGE